MDGLTIAFLVACVLGIWMFVSSQQKKQAAQEEYQKAIQKLKKDPTNSAFREDALRKGRHYSHLTRNSQGVTIYDEVAIKNDLDAATAGATLAMQTIAPVTTPSTPPEERLKKLDELKSKGLLTDQEHANRRAAIIDEL